MSGSLDGPFAKLDRADEHVETLKDLTSGPGQGVKWAHQYPVIAKAHRNGLEYRFYVNDAPGLNAKRCALIVGDCLFNLRAALDHLVYELHVRRYRGTVPSDAERESSFPILLTKPGTKRGGRATTTDKWNEIRRLSAVQRRAIEWLQPYNGRNDDLTRIRQDLSWLQTLNAIDKHRRLHVVRVGSVATRVPTFPREYGFRQESFWVPLEGKTEVFRWTFDVAPHDISHHVQQTEANNKVIAGVSLYEGGEHPLLGPLLEHIADSVEAVLRRFERYLG